ncbi:MAG: hypothetical protein ACFFAS_05875 [Promethearchaeota archaeon]
MTKTTIITISDIQGLCTVMSHLVVENRKFFMENCYRLIFMNRNTGMNPSQRVEIDKFIFINYLAYQGEELLASFEVRVV